MYRHGVIVGIAATVLAVMVGPAGAAAPESAAVVVRARFAATMPDRFGLDADGDGLIDLPNSPRVRAARDGPGLRPVVPARPSPCVSTGPRAPPRWAGSPCPWCRTAGRCPVAGGRHVVRSGASAGLEIDLPEGRYQVSLEVEAALPWGSARGRSTRQVAVEDLLVVAIGDSYAGGEGNPERPSAAGAAGAQWADAPGDPATEAAHAAAHRSTVAWPALAALALERADPGTSVTFVSVAATKAQVTAGLLGPQPGVSLVSQIDQVVAVVGERPIDLLLLSAGGNDIGFARIVRGLVDADRLADPVCYATDLQNVWDAADDGDWNRGSALRFALPWGVGCRAVRVGGRPVLPGLQGLPVELDRLAEAIAGRLHPAAVYLMEYPDPAGASSGAAACSEIVGDVTPPFRFHEIDRAEMAAGRARVVEPLNRILAEAAARHGWEFVGGVSAAFAAGHGYCGLRPDYPAGAGEAASAGPLETVLAGTGRWYRHGASLDPGTVLAAPGVSWWRTAAQSVVLQGPADAWETMGTLHPNELGQLAMARAFLSAFEH